MKDLNTRHCMLVAVLVTALCVSIVSCGKHEEPPAPPRPVRTVVVAGGSTGVASTYTGEIRSRYETD